MTATEHPPSDGYCRVMAWDHRISVVGHSANKAVCIAVTTLIQGMAAIARAMLLAEKVSLFENAHGAPVYDVVLMEGEQSRRIVAGAMAAFAGISREAALTPLGSRLLVSDNRKDIPEIVAFGGGIVPGTPTNLDVGADLPDELKVSLPRP